MRVGGKRSITIPLELGPANIKLPPGVPLIYNVELTEVFTNYL
jgi:FKBP-type peptidyl-prolyl cis-trans isomerase